MRKGIKLMLVFAGLAGLCFLGKFVMTAITLSADYKDLLLWTIIGAAWTIMLSLELISSEFEIRDLEDANEAVRESYESLTSDYDKLLKHAEDVNKANSRILEIAAEVNEDNRECLRISELLSDKINILKEEIRKLDPNNPLLK